MWKCEERLDPKTNVTRGFKYLHASECMRFEKGVGQKVRAKAFPACVSGRGESFALKEMNMKILKTWAFYQLILIVMTIIYLNILS